jgi:hypothetical protein
MITTLPFRSFFGYEPPVPTGYALAYTSRSGENTRVMKINTEDGTVTPLSRDGIYTSITSVTSDGKRMLFYQVGLDKKRHLLLVEGKNVREIPIAEHLLGGKISPDGKSIRFIGPSSVENNSQRKSRGRVYVTNADGSNLRQITKGDWHTYYAIWSPSSQYIYVESVHPLVQERNFYSAVLDPKNGKEILKIEDSKCFWEHAKDEILSPFGSSGKKTPLSDKILEDKFTFKISPDNKWKAKSYFDARNNNTYTIEIYDSNMGQKRVFTGISGSSDIYWIKEGTR